MVKFLYLSLHLFSDNLFIDYLLLKIHLQQHLLPALLIFSLKFVDNDSLIRAGFSN